MVSLRLALERSHGRSEGTGRSCCAEVHSSLSSSLFPLALLVLPTSLQSKAKIDNNNRVFLHATADSALKTVGMDDLKKFAADGENTTGSVRRGVVQNPPKIVNPSVGGTKGGGADN